ncbi:MAG TPA: hypothetical protein VF590_20035 [Isosphaeraceae bacterium]|jgi:hypothetical protein
MFATVITVHPERTQVQQIDAPTVKDCLVAWAGRIQAEGLDDEARTRLRGDMADFNQPPIEGFGTVWRLESDLGLGGEPRATVIVVETARR